MTQNKNSELSKDTTSLKTKKRGRPRKDVAELPVKVKNKRGRKPKNVDTLLKSAIDPNSIAITTNGDELPNVMITIGNDAVPVIASKTIPTQVQIDDLTTPSINIDRVKRPYNKRKDRKVHDSGANLKSNLPQEVSVILAELDASIPTIDIPFEAINESVVIEGTAIANADEEIKIALLPAIPSTPDQFKEAELDLTDEEIILLDMLGFISNRNINLIQSHKDLITMIHILFNVTDKPTIVIEYFKKICQFNSTIDKVTTEDIVKKFQDDYANVPDCVRPTLKLLFYYLKKLGYKTDKETTKWLKFNENDIPMLIMEAVYSTVVGQTFLTIKEQISKDMFINDYNRIFRRNQTINSYIKDDKVPLSHTVENAIVHLVNRKFSTNFSKTRIINHLLDATLIKETNIVKDWLSAANPNDIAIYKLEFDKFLAGINVKDEEYKESTIIRWMLGVLVNLFDQGFFDEILIFLGGQDTGKTTVIINALCKFFFENAIATDSFRWGKGGKDDFRHLYQSAIILDDELQSLKDADIENIKKFTSESNVKIREHYRQNFSANKRIASFIGATNNDFVFNDFSGGRRFLILDIIEKMDLIECYYDKDQNKYIPKTDSKGSVICKFDTDAIWYYIYCLYLDGLKPRDFKKNDQALENYRMKSNLEQIVNDLFVKLDQHITKYSDILKLLKDFDHSIRFTDRNLGNILKKMGCTPKHTKVGNIWNVSKR